MTKTVHKIYVGSFFIITILATLILSVYGYKYYTTPIDQRFFLSENDLLEPNGFIGQGLGVIGSIMMIIGVAVYMIRKRIKAFYKFGFLKHWLEFHIFLCTLGPILILFHTAFKFGGIVAVSFWSMVAVVLSGVVGRFLYVQIPHTIQGQMISMHELNSQSENLSHQLKFDYVLPEEIITKIEEISTTHRYKRVGLGTSIIFIVQDYFGIKNVISHLKRELKKKGISKSERKKIVQTAKAKLIISRRIGLLHTTQTLFKYWHVVHLPFAIIMFVIMVIHIAVEFIFGYRWIF